MTTTPVSERTIAAVLERQVRLRPDKVTLIDESGPTMTFSQLQTAAFRVAATVASLGVERQQPVVVLMDNHLDMAVVSVGLGVGGFVEVPVNTAYKGEMLRYILDNSGATLAIIDEVYADRIAQVAHDVPALETVIVRGARAELPGHIRRLDFDTFNWAEAVRPEPPQVSDICAILYTSGTEGPSKGALCPHGHAFQISASHAFDSGPDDVYLVVVPLFHAGGLFGGVFCALRTGATAVIQRGFSASRFWEDVRRFGATQTFLAGAMADFLWRAEPTPDDANNTLRDVTMVPAIPQITDYANRFGLSITSSYGQTETGTVMVTDPGTTRPFQCGRPRSFMQVRLVDDNDVDVEPGAVGEVVVRSEQPWSMMRGYHRMPDQTVHMFRNLWLHTGDAAYQDDNGCYVFVDRKKDALRRRGENVSSLEVEKYIAARPDITQAAIIAVPSEFTEDDIKAVVVLSPGAEFDPEAILHDLVERLPYFMVPRYYQAVQALPMTPTFKVRKGELRATGITPDSWDCQKAGYTVTRHGLTTKTPAHH